MTVAELIEALKAMPQDAEVRIYQGQHNKHPTAIYDVAHQSFIEDGLWETYVLVMA